MNRFWVHRAESASVYVVDAKSWAIADGVYKFFDEHGRMIAAFPIRHFYVKAEYEGSNI